MARTFLRLALFSIPIAGAILYFGTGRRVSPSALPIRAAAPVAAPAALSSASSVRTLSPPDPPVDTGEDVDHLAVALFATRGSLVSAVVDGETRIDGMLAPGDRRLWDVRRELVLTTDDGTAVTMALNGVDAKPLGSQGKATTIRVDLKNFRNYLPHR